MELLIAKALGELAVFDLMGYGRSFVRLHSNIRNRMVADRTPPPNIIDRVCFAVNNACVWYPKRVLCLQRATVITRLLRTYGVSAQMVLGAQRLPFKAHAWVEVNGHPINERQNVREIFGIWERC